MYIREREREMVARVCSEKYIVNLFIAYVLISYLYYYNVTSVLKKKYYDLITLTATIRIYFSYKALIRTHQDLL